MAFVLPTFLSPELDVARSLDVRLVAARKVQRGAEHRLAILLAELADTAGFRLLGYASIEQYAMAALELTSRVTRDLLRIGRSMPELPRLNAALAAGEVDWTKAREVVRVATAETDGSWTERAKTMSARVIEREVAAARIGDPAPTGEPDAELRLARARICFELEAADADVLYQALSLLRARSDLGREEIDDGALLACMARQIIATADPGETPTGERYRIVLQQCPSCERFDAPAAEVSETIAAEAACDAEIIDMQPGPSEGRATRAIPPVLRRKVLHRAGWKCEVPDCRNRLWLDVHHTEPWSECRTHDFAKLIVVCGAHHRAIHNGFLSVSVRPDGCAAVEHADGRKSVGPTRALRRATVP